MPAFARPALLAALGAVLPLAVQAADPDPERGRALAQRWCVSCHVVDEDGSGADAGPAFASMGDRSDAQLRGWLSAPHPAMPHLDLSGPDIDDLAAYIRAISSE